MDTNIDNWTLTTVSDFGATKYRLVSVTGDVSESEATVTEVYIMRTYDVWYLYLATKAFLDL